MVQKVFFSIGILIFSEASAAHVWTLDCSSFLGRLFNSFFQRTDSLEGAFFDDPLSAMERAESRKEDIALVKFLLIEKNGIRRFLFWDKEERDSQGELFHHARMAERLHETDPEAKVLFGSSFTWTRTHLEMKELKINTLSTTLRSQLQPGERELRELLRAMSERFTWAQNSEVVVAWPGLAKGKHPKSYNSAEIRKFGLL